MVKNVPRKFQINAFMLWEMQLLTRINCWIMRFFILVYLFITFDDGHKCLKVRSAPSRINWIREQKYFLTARCKIILLITFTVKTHMIPSIWKLLFDWEWQSTTRIQNKWLIIDSVAFHAKIRHFLNYNSINKYCTRLHYGHRFYKPICQAPKNQGILSWSTRISPVLHHYT